MLTDQTKLQLNKNASIFEDKGKFYLFYPMNRTYSVLNKDMLDLLRLCNGQTPLGLIKKTVELPDDIMPLIKTLFDRNILIDFETYDDNNPRDLYNNDVGLGMRLSIFPTTACNLQCKYCYADGGDDPRHMPPEIYEIAMKHVFESLSKQEDHVHLSIHGGGEPTLNFPLLRAICDKFLSDCSNLGIDSKISITSNGAFGKDVRNWCVKNNIGISFSLDGPPKIQDFQRPFRSGEASFGTILDNIQFFIESGRRIGIRATVTSFSVNAMEETIDMAKETGISSVHFEPLFETKRSVSNGLKPPKNSLFVEHFLPCFLKGLEYDIEVSYSALRCVDYPQLRFCSACGYNFGVTIDGNITSCYEVLNKSDPASNVFFIGKVNVSKNKVDLYSDRIRYLRTRITPNLLKCGGCFLRFNCAGDCLIKAYRASGGNLFGINEKRCELAQTVNKKIVCWIADGLIEPRDQRKKDLFFYDCGGLA